MCFFTIQDFEYLFCVGFSVFLNLFGCECFAGDIFPTGIADHAGKVPDHENDRMPQVLELAHLVDDNRVAEVQVRRRRIKTNLYPQGPTQPEALFQFFKLDNFLGATGDQTQRMLYIGHIRFHHRIRCILWLCRLCLHLEFQYTDN